MEGWYWGSIREERRRCGLLSRQGVVFYSRISGALRAVSTVDVGELGRMRLGSNGWWFWCLCDVDIVQREIGSRGRS